MLHVFTIESLGKVNIINWTLSSEVMEHICSGIHLANNKPLNSSTIVNKSFEEFSAMMTIATWALAEKEKNKDFHIDSKLLKNKSPTLLQL